MFTIRLEHRSSPMRFYEIVQCSLCLKLIPVVLQLIDKSNRPSETSLVIGPPDEIASLNKRDVNLVACGSLVAIFARERGADEIEKICNVMRECYLQGVSPIPT